MDKYKIVRNYYSAKIRRRTILTGLTLEQAQEHCKNPETSSSTAKGAKAARITRRVGMWFEGYTKE